MNERANNIIDSAIRMIREGGYHSFSFRQIASELGIKSASIHYHFPSKEDLGAAVAKRYTEEFLECLGEPSDHKQPVSFYIDAFQASLEEETTACLCGVLAAEAGRLPQTIQEALKEFTSRNVEWLEQAIRQQCPDWSKEKVEESGLSFFYALEGGITFAALTRQPEHLKQVGDWLKKLCA